MAEITLKGNPIHTVGELPKVDAPAPSFTLTKNDLSEVSLDTFAGKSMVLNIFPSVDTGVCAQSVRRFNEEAAKREGTNVLCISADLPFALTRFCGAEGIENVTMLSCFRHPEFGADYGVQMSDGPMRGLLSRAVVVIDPSGKVAYAEQVPEIGQEPDYGSALKAL